MVEMHGHLPRPYALLLISAVTTRHIPNELKRSRSVILKAKLTFTLPSISLNVVIADLVIPATPATPRSFAVIGTPLRRAPTVAAAAPAAAFMARSKPASRENPRTILGLAAWRVYEQR